MLSKEGKDMILDVIENAHRYKELNKGFAKAIEFLLQRELKALPAGRYEIDGERVYGMIAREQGHKKEDEQLETHEKYIDIQLVLEGTDDMGWKPRSLCKHPSCEYDQTSDIRFFTDKPDAWLSVRSGAFVIFFPEDAHMPLISSEIIHKVVVKVAVTPN
jgi:biofilm protein TabA